MSRFPSDLPRPTDVLDWPSGATQFEDVTVRLAGPFPSHAPDHAMFLIAEERVGHTADVVNVDQLPFGGFGGQEPLVLLAANLEFIRSLEFDWFCGGHGNIGEKSDVDFYRNYLDDVAALVNEYVPRPTELPDLSLTDYLAAGLDLDAKNRLLSQLNNHFGLYLYGKQIVDGVQPFWDGGPLPDREHPRLDSRPAASRGRGPTQDHRTAATQIRAHVQLRRRTAIQRPPDGDGHAGHHV
jgi:hypothetical protein